MQFSETLEVLEQMFEQHKLDNRDIQDFRQTVDECIARQVHGGRVQVSAGGGGEEERGRGTTLAEREQAPPAGGCGGGGVGVVDHAPQAIPNPQPRLSAFVLAFPVLFLFGFGTHTLLPTITTTISVSCPPLPCLPPHPSFLTALTFPFPISFFLHNFLWFLDI